MPRPDKRDCSSGQVFRRRDLLTGAGRPRDFNEYVQSFTKCERTLRDEDREWETLDPCGPSYMRAIRCRRDLLLGDTCWTRLGVKHQQVLEGSRRRAETEFWGLQEHLDPRHRSRVRDRQDQDRTCASMSGTGSRDWLPDRRRGCDAEAAGEARRTDARDGDPAANAGATGSAGVGKFGERNGP